MGPIIIPIDNVATEEKVLEAVSGLLNNEGAFDLIRYFKFNDVLHGFNGPAIVSKVREIIKEKNSKAGIFFDLKLPDTCGTNKNIVSRYAKVIEAGDILTVRDSCSIESFEVLRNHFPDVKIALVSVLTDMSEEECRRRYGMFPHIKLANDITNIQAEWTKESASIVSTAFDMVVCSPWEVKFLNDLFLCDYQFICPGIRDDWMVSGQQSRFTGVAEALNLGATFVVMGSQITKGNPDQKISAEESIERTLKEIRRVGYVQIDPLDPMKTLFSCGGFYESPRNEKGEFVRLLVGYVGKYTDESGDDKNHVGGAYFNFAKGETRPNVLKLFAKKLAKKIREECTFKPDVVLGAPMGGILLAGAVGTELSVKVVFAEKKVTKLADPENGVKEESMLIIKRHDDINPGDKVLLIEDLCNNFSTTEKIEALIEEEGGEMLAIGCAINRSEDANWDKLPVYSVSHNPTPQYRQDDPAVADLVQKGKVVWKPKHDWATLKKAMSA